MLSGLDSLRSPVVARAGGGGSPRRTTAAPRSCTCPSCRTAPEGGRWSCPRGSRGTQKGGGGRTKHSCRQGFEAVGSFPVTWAGGLAENAQTRRKTNNSPVTAPEGTMCLFPFAPPAQPKLCLEVHPSWKSVVDIPSQLQAPGCPGVHHRQVGVVLDENVQDLRRGCRAGSWSSVWYGGWGSESRHLPSAQGGHLREPPTK